MHSRETRSAARGAKIAALAGQESGEGTNVAQIAADETHILGETCEVNFFVPGIPAPQGSKRAFHHASTGKIMMLESSKRVKPWRLDVAAMAHEAMGDRPLLEGPIALTVTFSFVRPKSHLTSKGDLRKGAPLEHVSRPDVSKLARALEDALTGIVFRDDSQVCELSACKEYVPDGGGALVTIEEVRR
jgi:Holliday junction resolvase RusA-like endonuclease